MPLDWTKIYKDEKFDVGWNAIRLQFDDSLIGKDYSLFGVELLQSISFIWMEN